MGGIRVKKRGDYKKTRDFLNRNINREYLKNINEYGKEGVRRLKDATPVDTGKTSKSWDYNIIEGKEKTSISWTNSNVVENKRGYEFNVVDLLRYGHATRDGKFIEGNDFVEQTMSSFLDEISDKTWEDIIK